MKKVAKYKKMLLRGMLADRHFCVVSNDCWGGEVYRKLGVEYNTPFVGLYVMAPCYLLLLKDLHVIEREMKFIPISKYSYCNELRNTSGSRYPIGVLPGNIEIHFQHYGSEEEALSAWCRRIDRMNWDNLCVKFDAGKDLATPDLVEQFAQLNFPAKLCILPSTDVHAPWAVELPDWEQDGVKMFRKFARRFSIIKWLNGRGIHKAGYLEPWLLGISQRQKTKPA